MTVPILIFELDTRRVDVTGVDRAAFLEDVTTQAFGDTGVGDVRGALALDPHGAPLAMFDVVTLGDRFALLAADDAQATWIVDTLGGRTFLRDASFAHRPTRTIAVRGDEADKMLASLGLGTVSGRARVVDDVLLVPRPGGIDVVADPNSAADLADALRDAGAEPGTDDDVDDWRVRAGIPAWGREVVAPHLPEEAGLLVTHVHLAKGCYPGQEAVARMWMLGRPRRRLARVRSHAGALARGPLGDSARDAVVVTTVARDGQSALAFVPADAVVGTRLTRDDLDVVVETVIGDELPPGADPSVTRRRDRARTPGATPAR